MLVRSDHKRAYPPLDRSVAKALRQRRGGVRGRAFEPGRIVRFDFIAQRRALAIGDGRVVRRARSAFLVDAGD
jgi:hypothetical protein